MSDKPVTIEGSHKLWYRIQHNWIGSDGPRGIIMEGVLMIVMGIFFALLLPFSWCCEKWWAVYERFERRPPTRWEDPASDPIGDFNAAVRRHTPEGPTCPTA